VHLFPFFRADRPPLSQRIPVGGPSPEMPGYILGFEKYSPAFPTRYPSFLDREFDFFFLFSRKSMIVSAFLFFSTLLLANPVPAFPPPTARLPSFPLSRALFFFFCMDPQPGTPLVFPCDFFDNFAPPALSLDLKWELHGLFPSPCSPLDLSSPK